MRWQTMTTPMPPRAGTGLLAVPGWSLRVDGKSQPLVTADLWFRAALVPPGEHLLELAYRPPGLAAGSALSVAGALLFLLLAIAALLRA